MAVLKKANAFPVPPSITTSFRSEPAEPVFLAGKPWSYRGEGGANLVISLAREKTVVRFAKSKYAGKDQDAKIGEIAYFANEVMRPLLGPLFVRPLRIGVVGEEDFHRVKLEAQPFRPSRRCKKDINSRKVILSPDCVFLTPEYEENTVGDTFSVEIKPKQGWHSLKATCSVDLCHRCLKQYAKLYEGDIDSISKYCPLDLFSGDDVRMKRALFDLYEAPNNRFKLFKNGDLVYTESIGSADAMEEEMNRVFGSDKSLDHLAALLCTALLSPIESQKSVAVKEEFVSLDPKLLKRKGSSRSCDTDSRPLPANSILQKILLLQRHTDISDHDAKNLCDKLLSNIDDLDGLHQLVLWHPNTKLEPQLSPSEIDDVQQLQRFLLSVTAKDVSLLLTFREVEDDRAESLLDDPLPAFRFESLGKSFRMMISVIDLDPKPVHRISTWVKRKEEWLETYFNSVNESS